MRFACKVKDKSKWSIWERNTRKETLFCSGRALANMFSCKMNSVLGFHVRWVAAKGTSLDRRGSATHEEVKVPGDKNDFPPRRFPTIKKKALIQSKLGKTRTLHKSPSLAANPSRTVMLASLPSECFSVYTRSPAVPKTVLMSSLPL